MPRLSPTLFWRARREISPLAAQLLPACRDLESAANELRWIREHVQATPSSIPRALRVWMLCEKRGKGIPLQYVLGTQPFGDLEIKCRPGVLIPRLETEAYTLRLASLLSKELEKHPQPSLNILDLCTGTGCIPLLLLHSLLHSPTSKCTPTAIHIQGIDISPAAISLAKSNFHHNHRLGLLPTLSSSSSSSSSSNHHTTSNHHHHHHPFSITFTQADIFSPSLPSHLHLPATHQLDLLTSNPPYISPAGFARDTARSVRNHEPRHALVPDVVVAPPDEEEAAAASRSGRYGRRPEEDIFYARLLELAGTLRPRRVLMEVGGWEQAVRVVGMVRRDMGLAVVYETVEIWRDEPEGGECKVERIGEREVGVRGEGNGRAVYLCRGDDGR
ncbi:hypothetical protein VTK56DRAFT_111 [Thermocarpiscus australiensis]